MAHLFDNSPPFSVAFSEPELERLGASLGISPSEAKQVTVTATNTDRLEALLRNPRTISYLQDLEFKRHYEPADFNLWEDSVRLSNNPAEALERVAVLFQDLSQSREHLHWAIAKGLPASSIENLVRTIEPLIGDLEIGRVGAVCPPEVLARFYPKGVSESVPDILTQSAYHFYTTAYWVLRLHKQGVTRENAILQAFGVQLAYKLSDLPGNRWPLEHLPAHLDSLYRARDLASAYWGAVYGASLVDGTPFPGTSNSAEEFFKTFRDTIRRLLTVR